MSDKNTQTIDPHDLNDPESRASKTLKNLESIAGLCESALKIHAEKDLNK